MAKICGFCGTNYISEIRHIWFEIEECEEGKDEDKVCDRIEDAMQAMAAQFNIELNNCYLSDKFIKSLVKLDFVPMGTDDVLFALLDRGMSCLAFVFQTAAEQISSKQTDQ